MSKKDDIAKLFIEAGEAVENSTPETRNAAYAITFVVFGYIAGSLSYFGYKGTKAVIKAIENRK